MTRYPERSLDHERELVVLHSLDCRCRHPQCIADREAAQDAELDRYQPLPLYPQPLRPARR